MIPDHRTMTIVVTGTYEPCPACRLTREDYQPGVPVAVRTAGDSVFITPHQEGCVKAR